MSTTAEPSGAGRRAGRSAREELAHRSAAVAGGPARLRSFLRQSGFAYAARRLRFGLQGLRQHEDYPRWVRRFDTATADELASLCSVGEPNDVHFAFAIVGVGGDQGALDTTLASLLAQTCRAWSVQVEGHDLDASTHPYRPEVQDATHLFSAVVQAGDVVTPWALHVVATAIALDPHIDLIYSDCDHIDERGRRSRPWFKPSYNRELLLEQDYTEGLRFLRRTLLDRLRDDTPRAVLSHGDVLRLTELTGANSIRHIPHVLLHRARPLASTAPEPDVDRLHAGAAAVQAHLDRTACAAVVDVAENAPHPRLRVSWTAPSALPGVTVVVPTRDAPELLRVCIDGLLQRTDYPDLHVVIADNGSTDAEAVALLGRFREHDEVDVVALPGPFNYSSINNDAAALATTPLLLLLNNDIEVIHPDWLTRMVAIALQKDIGVVGAKLLYPDDTIQHAGIVLGMRPRFRVPGVAGHVLKHLRRDDPGYFDRLVHSQEVSAVTGACLLTHADLFNRLGGLDSTNLAVAFNDVDYCLRVKEAGHRIVWTPLAELYHHESVSRGSDETGEEADRLTVESAWMRARWGTLIDDDPMYNPNLTIDRTDLTLAYPPRVARPWALSPEALGRGRASGT